MTAPAVTTPGRLVALAQARTAGATTAALSLAAGWPRPAVVAELDPAGGSLAARLGLSANTGVLSLAAAGTRGLSPGVVAEHLQTVQGLAVLAGPLGAEQAEAALAGLWGPLAAQLAALPDADVLADLGRMGPRAAGPAQVLVAAGLVVLVARASAEGFAQLHHRLAALPADVAARAVVVLVGEAPGCRPADFERALGVEVAGALADDWRGAELVAAGVVSGPRFGRCPLARSARVLAASLAARLPAPAAAPPPVTATPNGALVRRPAWGRA